ncbi:MAG: 16S rRNA (guanine(527)-N(7))-methyltransferase RsmG [Pseudomonadaceae bacterium]|nr:16S rRNA (guanine(527)-N(7))-methyltransferase RsmG [Pseudomonadaceae bacterium]
MASAIDGLSADTVQQLRRFAELVVERNRAHNLVSRKDIDRLWERHVLDSLRALPGLAHLTSGTVVDIGSGGGFPGLVLAIARPELAFLLAERMAKKARFLSYAAHTLGLGHVSVEDRDAATLAAGCADVVTARAVTDPDSLWALAQPLLKADGAALLFMGADTGAWQPASGAQATALEERGAVISTADASAAQGPASGKLSGQIFSVTRST